jgi:hypothetical protein
MLESSYNRKTTGKSTKLMKRAQSIQLVRENSKISYNSQFDYIDDGWMSCKKQETIHAEESKPSNQSSSQFVCAVRAAT